MVDTYLENTGDISEHLEKLRIIWYNAICNIVTSHQSVRIG